MTAFRSSNSNKVTHNGFNDCSFLYSLLKQVRVTLSVQLIRRCYMASMDNYMNAMKK